jgi:hypothetical protein
MKKEIIITTAELEAKGWLNDTATATKVIEILPITASVNIWGEEIYFSIPVEADLENAKETVSLGDIAYWPQGKALCIFFGTTPVSKSDEIRPISAVNIIGEIEGNRELFLELLDELRQGKHITISRP